MIIETIFDSLFGFIVNILNNLDLGVQAVFNPLITHANSINALFEYVFYFIPVSVFILCLNVVIILYAAELVISIVNWTIRKVPTIS